MPSSRYLDYLPKLNSQNHCITSPRRNRYNCIAWAAGSDTQWWWPESNGFWPRGVSREISLPAFLDVFLTLGYEECQDADLEAGHEKVALFAKLNTSGNLEPTHAAKQLPDGRWTSKLGPLEDIEHDEVEDVSGPSYGEPVQFMRRSIRVERNGGMAVRRQRE